MSAADIFFYGVVFFLTGILIAGWELRLLTAILTATLIAAIFLTWSVFQRDKKFLFLAILTPLILVGIGRYRINLRNFQNIKIDFNQETNFKGLVIDDPDCGSGIQNLLVQLQTPDRGRILIKIRLYPEFQYGDIISFSGVIKKPSTESEQNYFLKEKINGSTDFPKAVLEKSGQGSVLRAFLFKIKNSVADSYKKILSPEQAAFLTALMLAETDNLNPDFKNALKTSGIKHLAVFSGVHLTLISAGIFAVFGSVFSAGWTFLFSGLMLLICILITGFRFSVGRAFIMGLIAAGGQIAGRLYNPRNALVFSVFLFVLFNPSLIFDANFHFSLLAVLGIIYLRPALKNAFGFNRENKSGFLNWRENLLLTFSVQLAVMPLLVSGSGGFPLLAFAANFLLFLLIPLTMILGFAVSFFSLFFEKLAIILGWLISLPLHYEIAIINLFARFSPRFNFRFGFWLTIAYYLLLILFTKRNNELPDKKESPENIILQSMSGAEK